ncbi:MAG: putative lipid II flippase FtsW [Deltaproteobacteria bacterium]|nr:putative lipid II flippase FtsW [Deltaproteobacteria bacterium]
MDEGTAVKAGTRQFDRPLFIAVVLLLGFGVVMVYSASAVVASQVMHDSAFFLTRQAIYAAIGILAMLIASRVDYHFYEKIVYPLLGASAVALVLPHTPLGLTINGAARWIAVGPITVQPSEIAKVALVLWLSYSLARKTEKIRTFSVGFLPHIVFPGIMIALCLTHPDFGTAVVIAALAFALLFVAGARLGYMLLALIAAAPVAYALVAGSEYRLKRILAFLDPLSNRLDDGYQLSQSMFGFASGGVTGVGLGDGLQKLLFLPEAHNDFIGAIVAEELGVIGIWSVIAVFAFVVARGIAIGLKTRDDFGKYVAVGITVLIGAQALANLGVAMGLLPTKGLNLPFVSFGGTALIISLYSVGILLNISRGPAPKAAREEPEAAVNTRRSSTVAAVEATP